MNWVDYNQTKIFKLLLLRQKKIDTQLSTIGPFLCQEQGMLYPVINHWSLPLPRTRHVKILWIFFSNLKNCKLWLLIHVTLKQLFTIDVSSWISTLFVVMQGRRRNNSILQFMVNMIVQILSL